MGKITGGADAKGGGGGSKGAAPAAAAAVSSGGAEAEADGEVPGYRYERFTRKTPVTV